MTEKQKKNMLLRINIEAVTMPRRREKKCRGN